VLSDKGVEFLVVDAFAMAAHGFPRTTGDIDIWIRATADNAARVWRALARFGVPLHDLTPGDLAGPDVVFQIGVAPAGSTCSRRLTASSSTRRGPID